MASLYRVDDMPSTFRQKSFGAAHEGKKINKQKNIFFFHHTLEFYVENKVDLFRL